MHYSKLVFTLFCFLFLHQLTAQSNLSQGYYVGFKKDTVRGFFDFEDLAINKVDFYADKKTSVPKRLTPDNVAQIETLDSVSVFTHIYVYKDQKEPLFITKFASGNITLYKGFSSNPDEKEVFFINSIKIPLIRKISKNNPKEFLNTYFKGCELGANFSVNYAPNSLLAAIKQISKCAFPEAKVEEVVRKRRKIEVELGVKAGLYTNKSAVIGWLDDRKGDANVKSLLGLVGGIRLMNHFFFYTGLNLFQRQLINNESYTQLFCNPVGCYIDVQTPFNLTTNFLEIPFSVHYEFNKNKPKFMPKIIVGGSILRPLNATLEVYGIATTPSLGSDKLYTTGRANTSFFIGGGVKHTLKNQSILELNLKYAYETENPILLKVIHSDRFELSFNYLFSLGKKD
jgi:hypothetical protein